MLFALFTAIPLYTLIALAILISILTGSWLIAILFALGGGLLHTAFSLWLYERISEYNKNKVYPEDAA